MTFIRQWNAEQLRFTVFYGAPLMISTELAQKLWVSFANETPLSAVDNFSDGSKTVAGNWMGRSLQLILTGNRADFYLNPLTPNSLGVPDLGPSQELFSIFFQASKSWLINNLNTIKPLRIAFGGAVISLARDFESSYATLKKQLDFISFEDNWRDLFIQINSPKTSTLIKHQTINRLLKWMAIQFDAIIVEPGKEPRLERNHGNRVEIDFSSDVNGTLNESAPNMVDEILAALIDVDNLSYKFS